MSKKKLNHQWKRVRADRVLPKVTNTKFAKENDDFRKACELANVEPTARQASKFRNKRGSAFRVGRKAE